MADPKEDKTSPLKAEIAGLLFLAFAFLIGLSLVSSHAGTSGGWVGLIGNNVAAALFVTIGYGAYVFPVLFLVIAFEFLVRQRKGIDFRISLPISQVFLIIALSGLIALVSGNDASGGIVGGLVRELSETYLGWAGSFIVLVTILIISVRLGTGLSLVQLSEKIIIASAFIAKTAASLVSKAKETRPSEEEGEEEEVSAKTPRKKPTIVTAAVASRSKKEEKEGVQDEFHFTGPKGAFRLPGVSLLDPASNKGVTLDKETLLVNSKILERKLLDFEVQGHVTEVRPGPVVTTYEFEPAPGIKVNKITNLSDDIALAMRVHAVRILAPVPGKAVVGIEVPNMKKEGIFLREIIESPTYAKSHAALPMALGKDISGEPFVTDLAKMPHLLVAGATGAGKSVSINAIILSLLFKATPEDVRFLFVDPKMLELSPYEGIPHLLTPVVTDVKRANIMLKGVVTEMEKRYRLMAEVGSKNIEKYNERVAEKSNAADKEDRIKALKKLPYIVVVIDELADLMMTAGRDVEESLVRLSQMARAAGIHLIVATQRPSVDVITGLIKANFPARISFQVPSKTDSRTILDSSGAESLLGQGDMLFMPPGSAKLIRIHGGYVSEKEVKRVADFLRKQGKPEYRE
ncbi:MAG: DNA translocase FtsK 4TM domain-containing protein, partial [Thermodesulfobacteriota bacterium]